MSRLSGSNTDEIDAADVTLLDLPAKHRSHGRHIRINCPHSRHILLLKHTAFLKDEQRWQAATVPGYLGDRTFWLPGIKRKAYLLPLRVYYVNEVRI